MNALAATGDPRAADILRAMVERDLYTRKSDQRIVIARKDGDAYAVTDPLSGESVGALAKSDLRKLSSNNRLRRAIRTALGGLTLASKDPVRRIAAADAVFKAPKSSQIALLTAALEREQDDAVKDALARALAAAQLTHGKTPEIRIAAISAISAFTDPGVTGLLKRTIAGSSPAEVKDAAKTALEEIEEQVFFWELLGQLFTGLSLGSVLLLAAIGLAITFGVMGVINMAHGEMVMIGAYTTFVVQEIFRTTFPPVSTCRWRSPFRWPFWSRERSESRSNAASSVFSMVARSKRCWRPGASA